MYFSIVSVFLVALPLIPNAVVSLPIEGEVIYQPYVYKEYEMPESCGDKTYCFDKGDKYPEDKISKLLDNISLLQIDSVNDETIIGSRSGSNADEEPDCPFNTTVKPIYYIVDQDDNVRVVVQKPGKFQQIYTTRVCATEGRITRETPHFLMGTTLQTFNIQCISCTMNYDFFVLSREHEEKMEIVQVLGGIPVCCRCRYSIDE